MLTYPRSLAEDEGGTCHARLTSAGKCKIATWKKIHDADERAELEAGVDYEVKEGRVGVWLSFQENPGTEKFRHTWILTKAAKTQNTIFSGSSSSTL